MDRPFGELRQADTAQPMQTLVERQNRGQIVFFRYRYARDHIGSNVTEVQPSLQDAVAEGRILFQPDIDQVEGELRVAELVLRDVPGNLRQHRLGRLPGETEKEIRGEMLADHVARQLANRIVDRQVQIAPADVNELLV